MIYILDNFLPKDMLDEFLSDDSEFLPYETPKKTFWAKMPSEQFNQYVIDRIEEFEGKEIKNIFSFFREAKKGQDNDWRIHNDTIIFGEQPDRAIVLFMESEENDSLNGTAFWSHKKYGDIYQEQSNEEFNRLLFEDANNKDLWNLKSVIGYKQNRLLSYPCNYFHSKYPNEFEQPRRVFVMFYQTKK